MSIDVSKKFPYKDFTETYIEDVGYFVRIPKIFVKAETDPLTGFITRKISDVKIKGFHCHPAFMYNGHEQNYLLIGKYPTRGTVEEPTSTPLEEGEEYASVFTYSEMLTAIQNLQTAQKDLTYHPYNIYEHHLLALLMLIEYSTTNVYNEVNEDYHGIKGFWGYNGGDDGTWIYGLKKAKTTNHIEILNNLGNQNIFVDTEIVVGTDILGGYIVSAQDKIGDGYDLNDIFFAKSNSTLLADSSFGSRQNFNANATIEAGTATWKQGTVLGLAQIFVNQSTENNLKYPFRISKFAD